MKEAKLLSKAMSILRSRVKNPYQLTLADRQAGQRAMVAARKAKRLSNSSK